MPAYNSGLVNSLEFGDSVTLFSAESTGTITTSQQAFLRPAVTGGPAQCQIEGFFSGVPGAFELDVQFASTDSDAYYEPYLGAGQITAVDSNNHFSAWFVPAPAPFVRLNMKTNGNTVNLTAKVTR